MSLFYTLHSTFDFILDRSDGRYALTHRYPNYPVSSVRDEFYVRPNPSSRSLPSSAAHTTHTTDRSYDEYPLTDTREVCPGILASGQLTMNHPLVDTYIEALVRIMPRAPSHPSASSASSPVTTSHPLPPHPAAPSLGATVSPPPPELTHWIAHNAGIASALTVSNVINQQFQLFPGPASRLYADEISKLTHAQKEAILALAALKVLNHPSHPAHFALWGKNILHRTAEIVNAVLQLKPCPIFSRVSWIGIPENVWLLQGMQSRVIPTPPQKKAGGMTLRKRKAPATSQYADEDVEGVRVNTRKRARTTRASQKAKDAAAAAAAAAQVTEVIPQSGEATPEAAQSTALCLSGVEIAAPVPDLPPAPMLDLFTRAVKQELAGGSPVLQAIGLMLDLPERLGDTGDISPPAASSFSTEPIASPPVTRRSTRARRKPAPPGTLSLVSTPVSALSTPILAGSPSPSSEKRTRSGSRGSSTAVSDGGYPSEEGTVVDTEVSAGSASAKGKRKAAEIEEPGASVEPAEPTPTPTSTKGGAKGKAKKAKAPARKRAKVEDVPAEPLAVKQAMATASDAAPAVAERQASGEENVPEPVPTVVATAKKRKTGSGGGKRKAARRA